jgi:hypothetical protein
MFQEHNEHTKSNALYRGLEQLENQFSLLTIYLVEIAKVKLFKKNEILNAARLFSAIKPLNVPKNHMISPGFIGNYLAIYIC